MYTFPCTPYLYTSLFFFLKENFYRNFKIRTGFLILMIRTIFVILIYVNISSNFPILCISKQYIYIYISRLQEGTEFSSIEVSSRVKPSRNGVCVHQNRWPALESARPSVTWFCPYLIV